MTDKLSEDRLLGKLKTWYNRYPYCSTLDNKAYNQIVAIIKNQPTITKRNIENCVGAIQYSVQTHEDWGYVEDILREMLIEIGVSIKPSKVLPR